MKPKVNKLVTLLLLLGIFAAVKEMESRIECLYKKDLAEWASFNFTDILNKENTINPYSVELNVTSTLIQILSTKQKTLK